MAQRNRGAVLLLRTRSIGNALRTSLFFAPALLVIAGVGLSFAIAQVDRTVDTSTLPSFVRIPPDAAQTLLATIAGATITTVGVVFSITVVSVQLASGQFSPRVIRGFFRDKGSQLVVGVLAATFAYCVVGLYSVAPGTGANGPKVPTVSVGVAVLLSLTSILTIVGYLNHATRLLYVGTMIQRVADETVELVERIGGTSHEDSAEDSAQSPTQDGHVVVAATDGWVQQISSDGVLEAVPPASTVRLETRAGCFVARGMPLATVWPPPEDDAICAELADAFIMGNERTMQQDVDFGLRQLTDIALRALSPGINDPTTAIEVVVRVGAILRRLLVIELPPPVRSGPDGRLLLRPFALGHAEYVAHAYNQVRLAAAPHPAVCIAILRTLRMLTAAVQDSGHHGVVEPLRRQIALTIAGCEQAGLLSEDLDAIRRAAVEDRALEEFNR